jgi:hypothetical protein
VGPSLERSMPQDFGRTGLPFVDNAIKVLAKAAEVPSLVRKIQPLQSTTLHAVSALGLRQ